MTERKSALESIRQQVTISRAFRALAVVVTIAVMVSFINGSYSTTEQLTQVRPYDGVTLYRGLLFGSGPVAGRIPSIRKVSGYFPAEYKKLEDPVINSIRTKDPTFFDRFATEMQSGDRVRITEMLRQANKMQKEALLDVTKSSRTDLAMQLRQAPTARTSRDPEAENDANVAVEAVVWVAVLVVLLLFWVKAKSVPADLKGLRFEQYVDEIAKGLPRARDLREMREAKP